MCGRDWELAPSISTPPHFQGALLSCRLFVGWVIDTVYRLCQLCCWDCLYVHEIWIAEWRQDLSSSPFQLLLCANKIVEVEGFLKHYFSVHSPASYALGDICGGDRDGNFLIPESWIQGMFLNTVFQQQLAATYYVPWTESKFKNILTGWSQKILEEIETEPDQSVWGKILELEYKIQL